MASRLGRHVLGPIQSSAQAKGALKIAPALNLKSVRPHRSRAHNCTAHGNYSRPLSTEAEIKICGVYALLVYMAAGVYAHFHMCF